MTRPTVLVCVFALSCLARGADPGQVHLVYTAKVPVDGPRHYLFQVEVTNPPAEVLHFVVPHWAPGAYRELTVGARSRKVAWELLTDFEARDADGKRLPVEPDGDRRWKVTCGSSRRVVFSYRNTEPGRPDNNRSYLGEKSGLIDGPRNWMYLEGFKDVPLHVHFDLPEGWDVASGLDPTFDPKVFTAKDYDRLVDCPTLVGAIKSWSFTVRGVPHRIAIDQGDGGRRFDEDAFTDMVKRIVEEYVRMFDDVPYEHYTFLYTPGGGGLEHLTSTTIGGTRTLSPRFLQSVTAHEFFHTWNVKRLRPFRLGPFDYTGPQPVNDLWIAEGLTSYYTEMGLWRAGLTQTPEFLQNQAGAIRNWEQNPGHLIQSPEASSRGVWTDDVKVSYYLQGQILGMMIDLAIRDGSDNRWSLDDVMRHMYVRHGGYYRHHPSRPGYQSTDWPEQVLQLTGVDLQEFWARHIRDCHPVDWNRYLGAAGWRVEYTERGTPSLGSLNVRSEDNVLEVEEGTPAWRAGFRPDDVLVSFQGSEVNRRTLRRLLRGLAVGEPFRANVRRGGTEVVVEGMVEGELEAAALDLSMNQGEVTATVPRGTAWYEGGMRDGDRVLQLNDMAVVNADAAAAFLRNRQPGESVRVQVRRVGEEKVQNLTVTMRAMTRRVVGAIVEAPDPTPKQMAIRKGMATGSTQKTP